MKELGVKKDGTASDKLEKRGVKSAAAMVVLDVLESIVQPLEFNLYAGLQQQALQRIAMREAKQTGKNRVVVG